MELVEFLLARIAEDEEQARTSEPFRYGVWRIGGRAERTIGDHVLAECEAKRRIVEWAHKHPKSCDEAHPGADVYHPDGHGPNEVARLLALPYADHEQFQEEWKL